MNDYWSLEARKRPTSASCASISRDNGLRGEQTKFSAEKMRFPRGNTWHNLEQDRSVTGRSA